SSAERNDQDDQSADARTVYKVYDVNLPSIRRDHAPPPGACVAVLPSGPPRRYRRGSQIFLALCLVPLLRISTSSRDARRDRLGDLVRLRGRFFIRPIIGR